MNDREYRAALRAISPLMEIDPQLESPLGQVLDDLVHVVEEYEAVHFQFDKPSALELARFRAEEFARRD